TTYRVEYGTPELIRKAAKAVEHMPAIKKAMIKTTKTALEFDDAGIVSETKASYTTTLADAFSIPDLLYYIQERTKLTRATILKILTNSGRIGEVFINPQLFLDNAVLAIKEVLFDLMIDGIKYERIGTKEYEMRLFEDYPIHVNDLTFKISKKYKTIYSNLCPLDSNVEYEFAGECESRDDIEFYFKLPSRFKIKTPIGKYNPDWALIKRNEKTVYFVAETKSKGQELKASEERKIKCGIAHFKEFDDIKYRQVATVGELDYE
ncbi:MAG: DEAD/DEAH box helicase, partial [Candidatus Scalindua sp.]